MKNNIARRARERQELRLRIVEAARELFVVGGEEAVTLRRVAEKIEYSPTTIYLCFQDKDTLIRELCANEFAAFARVFKQAERVTDPVERLKKISLAYLDFGLQFPGHYRSMFMNAAPLEKTPFADAPPSPHPSEISEPNQPSDRTPNIQAYDFLHAGVFKAAAAGCFKSEHRDVAMITQLIWSSLHGIITLHLVRARHPEVPWRSIHAIAELMIEGLFYGLARSR